MKLQHWIDLRSGGGELFPLPLTGPCRTKTGRATPAPRAEVPGAGRRRPRSQRGPPEKGEVLLRGVGTLRYLFILSDNSACQVPMPKAVGIIFV